MRKLYDSGALIVILFLVGFVLTLLRRRADNIERSIYRVPEPTPEKEYSFYLPVRDRIIPKEQWKEQPLEVLAALWAVDEIRSEELPPLAADLLEGGYDGKYLRRLAGEMVAGTRADVAGLAAKAFAELGVLEPISVTAANRLLTRYFAEKVLNRQLDPAKAVLKIAYLHDWDHQGPGKEFVMLNYAYREQPVSSNHGNQLDEQTREACVSFIQANPPEKDTSPNPGD
jgi:hypothetical protein